MITLNSKQEMILRHYRDKQSIRYISRETGISRPTVKKYVCQYEAVLEKAGIHKASPEIISEIASPPTYDSSNRKPRLLTPEMEVLIHGFLTENHKKRLMGQQKQQMKRIDIHESLLLAGHKISYSTVCEWLKRIEPALKETYIRQRYNPGEETEFDWGKVKLYIGGYLRTLSMAVFTSAYSNYRYAVVLPREDMACFIEAHVRYITHTGGVYKRFVYDNLKTAVKRFVGLNDRELTDDFLKMSLYYCFGSRFCNVAKGNEKGHVERSVEYVRRKAFCRHDEFGDLDQVNAHLNDVLNDLNQRELSGRDCSSLDLHQEELPVLKPAPAAYEYAECDYYRVDKYATVSVKTNHYSVPEYLTKEKVFVKIFATRILIYDDRNIVAAHQRNYSAGQWIININHYLKTLSRKPGALSGSEALNQSHPEIRNIYERYFAEKPRDFVQLLQYINETAVTMDRIEAALNKLHHLHTEITFDKVKAVVTSTMNKIADPFIPAKVDAIAMYCQMQLQALSGLIPDQKQFKSGGLHS